MCVADNVFAAVNDSTSEGASSTVRKDSVLACAMPDSIMQRLRNNRDSLIGDSVHGYTIIADTNKWHEDSLKNDTMKKSKSSLDDPVRYEARDSITFDMVRSRARLYGESKVDYQNLELTAELIDMSLDSSIVHATGIKEDSTEEIIGKPLFQQGNDQYEPDSISYNFKTHKAFITNVYTKQGEGFMTTEEGKRDSTGIMYVARGKYTTCDAKKPHFYLKMTRAKVYPGKNVIFGPAYLVVQDVPLPLAIPYGFFPFTHSYQSGFIMPTYGEDTDRGFYMREGGYYFAINDYMDLKLLGEVYTKGSWGLSTTFNYKKRYRFSGDFNLSYEKTVYDDHDKPSVSNFKLTWTHRSDAKSNPTQSFSASVNYVTTSYEQNNLTSRYNPASYTQSTRTSSVSYSKTFNSLGLSLSTSANMSQNVRDTTMSVTFPTLNITVSRFYPFKRKRQVGAERWYEKIAMSYTGTLSNSISTKSYNLFHTSLMKDWQNGMRHQIPVSASFQLMKYLNVTGSFNFTDRMYTKKVYQSWDQTRQTVVRDTTLGFYNVYNFDVALSFNTKLYGFYKPAKWFGGKKVQAIRHVFTPSVSFSYAPDFSSNTFGFYGTYQKTNTAGEAVGDPVQYSYYAGSVYGTPGSGMTGNVTMDVSNNVEMKVYSKRDSTGFKKISLIDELGASLSYNMATNWHKWSDLNMRLRLKLTKSYTFSMNAVFATYAYEFNESGNVIVGNNTEWSKGRFGRFQGMSQNLSYTFNNGTFRKIYNWLTGNSDNNKDDQKPDRDDGQDDDVDPEMQNLDPDMLNNMRNSKKKDKEKGGTDDDGYLKFSMPWSLSVSYGIIMSENTSAEINKETMRYPYKFTQTLNFNGSLRIAEGWNISFSSGYDFENKSITMTTASLGRDLHCFNINASVVIAPYHSFNINFQANSSTLKDVLRWKKQSGSSTSNLDWY